MPRPPSGPTHARAVLSPIWTRVYLGMSRACLDGPAGPTGPSAGVPFAGASFRAASFCAAAAAIAPEGGADFAALEAEVGAAELAAMVQHGLVAIRPFSAWARDGPAAAFGARSRDSGDAKGRLLPLAPAAGATELFCMRRLAAEGRLRTWKPY